MCFPKTGTLDQDIAGLMYLKKMASHNKDIAMAMALMGGGEVETVPESVATESIQGLNNTLYTEDNIATVESHLPDRLGAWDPEFEPYNSAMVDRQRAIMNGDIEPTQYDQNWMLHELKESELMDKGVEYDDAHQLANQFIGLGPKDDWSLWPTEIIEQFREYLVGPAWEEPLKNR